MDDNPDFLFYAGHHLVILEVDEHQHRSRPPECERIRMINLWQQSQMPIFFIRCLSRYRERRRISLYEILPDPYKKPGEKKRCENELASKRLSKMKLWLDYALKTNPLDGGATVVTVYLYYDGYTDSVMTTILHKIE